MRLAPVSGRPEFDFGIDHWQVRDAQAAPSRGIRTGGRSMSGTYPNQGPQDIGGVEAGPVDTLDHGMKFWERQANSLRSVLQRNKIMRTDELRRAAEDLGPRYSQLAYFEITTSALRTVLLEKGLITEDELKAKMDEVRARFNVPDEMESPLKKGAAR
jgi:hypothetical protein